ncbi:XdhC/CoxI family protein [Candidatus Hecatella orcuttiae]|jgi:xanthine dehydrogenase accessory factor|uniref:XdhC family protein n=1 Tax=Candidatus Hecatella orcuttiae TaxID=1935119 RepID=UPI002867DBEC|nr:XdhC/CoxI family protein [Candidatus Hecatella orcuttiae]
MSVEVYQKIAELTSRGEKIAVATVVKAEGSTPQGVGAKMIIREDGSRFGTIGGGCIENAVVAEAQEALKDGKSRLSSFKLTEEEAGGVGMICGGTMDVMVEVIQPTPTLLIIGSGHIAEPLHRLGRMLGFQVVVVDPFARKERFPEADRVIAAPVDEGLAQVAVGPQTYVVVVTRHQYDEPALRAVLPSQAAYIGLVGSLNRVNTIFKMLREEGVADEAALARVHAPIGLDIGAKTVEEIALSIMAEIVHVQRGGTGRPLKLKRLEAASQQPPKA